MLSLNSQSVMTSRLVAMGIFRSDPIKILDIGARGGIAPRWNVFDDQLRAIGFELDEAECKRLNEVFGPRLTCYPVALGRRYEMRNLLVTNYPAACGFYGWEDLMKGCSGDDNVQVRLVKKIQTWDFDSFAEQNHVRGVNFAKIDVEGGELDILKGATRLLATPELIGLEVEVRFSTTPNGAPTFSEVDLFLRKYGFELFDLDTYKYSRNRLPMPSIYDYRDDEGQPIAGPTTSGQVLTGDALFIRRIRNEGGTVLSREPMALLKAACLFELFGLMDCSAEILFDNRDILSSIVSVQELLNNLSSKLVKGCSQYGEYLEYSKKFMQSESRIYGPSGHALAEAWRILRRVIEAEGYGNECDIVDPRVGDLLRRKKPLHRRVRKAVSRLKRKMLGK